MLTTLNHLIIPELYPLTPTSHPFVSHTPGSSQPHPLQPPKEDSSIIIIDITIIITIIIITWATTHTHREI